MKHAHIKSIVESVMKDSDELRRRAIDIRQRVSAFFKQRFPDVSDFDLVILTRGSTTLLAIIDIMRPDDDEDNEEMSIEEIANRLAKREQHTMRTMLLCRSVESLCANLMRLHTEDEELIGRYITSLEETVDDIYEIVAASAAKPDDSEHEHVH